MQKILIALLAVIPPGCAEDLPTEYWTLEDPQLLWLSPDGQLSDSAVSGGRLVARGLIPDCFHECSSVRSECELTRTGDLLEVWGEAFVGPPARACDVRCDHIQTECRSPVLGAGEYRVRVIGGEGWRLQVTDDGAPLPTGPAAD